MSGLYFMLVRRFAYQSYHIIYIIHIWHVIRFHASRHSILIMHMSYHFIYHNSHITYPEHAFNISYYRYINSSNISYHIITYIISFSYHIIIYINIYFVPISYHSHTISYMLHSHIVPYVYLGHIIS